MTRKKFINNLQRACIAIYKSEASLYHDGAKLGECLKHIKNNAKDVPEKFGSYEAAWNCEAMLFVRRHYMKEVI